MNNDPKYTWKSGRSSFSDKVLRSILHDSFYPRTLIQLFTRKNFGERYLSLVTIFVLALIFACGPFVFNFLLPPFNASDRYLLQSLHIHIPSIFELYYAWFIMAGLIIVLGVFHVIRARFKSSIQSMKSSLYDGDCHSFFYSLPFVKKSGYGAIIEIFYEPIIFLLLGIGLRRFAPSFGGWLMNFQSLGFILIIASVWYSLSYIAAWRLGRGFVLGQTDEMLINKSLTRDFGGADFSAEKPKEFSGRDDTITYAE